MKIIRLTALCIALLLAACATTEGVFAPACIVYEGDRIELRDGGFEWHRFTDQINVDASGNAVDPFPGYPKTGRYESQSGRLRFYADDGVELADHYLVKHGGQFYLLTAEQRKSYLGGAAMPACALALSAEGS